MKKLVIAIIALLVIGAVGTAVFAGEMKKEGSVMLGYGMPSGDAGDDLDGGIAFGFGYEGYKINDNFSIGAEFLYTGNSGEVTGVADVDFSVIGILPYAKYSKEIDMGSNKADLYGIFGMGMYMGSTEVDFSAAYNALGVADTEDSESEFGFNLGGGIMFPMGDKMKLGADLRYHLVAEDVNYFIPSVKFTYSF